jgi:hypothetical protein
LARPFSVARNWHAGFQKTQSLLPLVLRDARPVLPDELSDRQQDGVEPLLAIADIAGNGWPAIARAAVVELCTQARQLDDSIGVRLLTDIRQVFESRSADKVSSVELAEALAGIETSPWSEWSHSKPLTVPKLARLLRRFEITPHTVRWGDTTFKGYELADFEDSFRRYLPAHKPLSFCYPDSKTVTSVTTQY